jgi:hypothetical protein
MKYEYRSVVTFYMKMEMQRSFPATMHYWNQEILYYHSQGHVLEKNLLIIPWTTDLLILFSFLFLKGLQYFVRTLMRGENHVITTLIVIYIGSFSSLSHRWPFPILAILFIPFGFLAIKDLYIIRFPFHIFDYERTWWRLLQKRVVRTKVDICIYSSYFVIWPLYNIYTFDLHMLCQLNAI